MKLRDIGEDRLLGQLFSRLSLGEEVVNGLGDDCAVVETRDHRNLLYSRPIALSQACISCRRQTRSMSAGKR